MCVKHRTSSQSHNSENTSFMCIFLYLVEFLVSKYTNVTWLYTVSLTLQRCPLGLRNVAFLTTKVFLQFVL